MIFLVSDSENEDSFGWDSKVFELGFMLHTCVMQPKGRKVKGLTCFSKAESSPNNTWWRKHQNDCSDEELDWSKCLDEGSDSIYDLSDNSNEYYEGSDEYEEPPTEGEGSDEYNK